LSSLNILNEYYKNNDTNDEQEKEETTKSENIFSICLKAEQTPASLDEYRQKLYYLEKLDPVACSSQLSSNKNLNDVNKKLLFLVKLFIFNCLNEIGTITLFFWCFV
jgi:hypothetical protein